MDYSTRLEPRPCLQDASAASLTPVFRTILWQIESLAGGRILALLLLLLLGVPLASLSAQDDIERTAGPLIDQEPCDLITLKAAAGGASVSVFPIPFPGRQIPSNPRETDKLSVVLLRFPEREYEVRWRDIARVELFEQRIYDEALQKLASKDFIGAFQNLSYLLKNYPSLPRLEELRQEFLLKSAAERYQAGEYRQTLSALEELRASAPDYRASTVLKVLSEVADSLIGSYQREGDLASSMALLNRLRQAYGPSLPAVTSWDQKIETLAATKRDEAIEYLKNKEYRRARRAATEMLSLSSSANPADNLALLQQINREHPMVHVGVMQSTTELDPSSLVNWSARRAGLLVQHSLFEFLQTGPEGGRYGFALGTYRVSEDRQQLLLSIDPALQTGIDAFGLAQILLERANPQQPTYDPSWASILKAVSIGSSGQILVQLQRPNVLPHALLQWILPPSPANGELSRLPGPYHLETRDENETSFAIRHDTARHGQPVEIIETFYSDPKLAVNDLLRGKIDVVDQIYPVDAKRLAVDPRVRIGTYALPTTHMLIPISKHAYLANAKFRRALLYATNRQGMLSGELLNSSDPNDGRVISGPFPLGSGSSDPLSYAYNTNVKPIESDPQLARLLLVMTQQELNESAQRGKKPEPKLEKLIVGCSDFEFARVAVQAMIQQWANVGIEAEMRVFSTDTDLSQTCDLLYVTATMWEPATDIERLLGGNGLARSDNPFIVQALETLRLARNWREIRTALQDLHQLIDYHLPILPLWQITDRYAVRNYIEGLENQPLSLYQDIAAWRINLGQVKENR